MIHKSNLPLKGIIMFLLFFFEIKNSHGQVFLKNAPKYLEIYCPVYANKAIPKIVFYVRDYYDTAELKDITVYFHEIKKCDFEALRQLITANELLLENKKEKCCSFKILEEKKEITLFSKDRNMTRQVFDKILPLFANHPDFKIIKERFDDFNFPAVSSLLAQDFQQLVISK